jgi:hypothetical protein
MTEGMDMGKIRQIGVAAGLAAMLASPAALAGGGHIFIGGGDHHLHYGISIPLEGYGYYYGPRYYGYPGRRYYDYRYYDRRYYGHRYYGEPRHYRRSPWHRHCYRDRGHTRCYRHRH